MVDTERETASLTVSPDEPAVVRAGFTPCGCRSEGASRWYVIVTAYQAERAVERAVRALGMPTWLGEHEDSEHRIRLMFPGYLLFQADTSSADRWRNLYTQPGVSTILGTRGERPTPLRVGALNGLFLECGPDGVIRQDEPAQPGQPIKPGAQVEFAAGVYKGWRAICQWSTEKRVGVLFTMFGRDTPVEAPIEHVRVLANAGKTASQGFR